jgi:hypothetical protein
MFDAFLCDHLGHEEILHENCDDEEDGECDYDPFVLPNDFPEETVEQRGGCKGEETKEYDEGERCI